MGHYGLFHGYRRGGVVGGVRVGMDSGSVSSGGAEAPTGAPQRGSALLAQHRLERARLRDFRPEDLPKGRLANLPEDSIGRLPDEAYVQLQSQLQLVCTQHETARVSRRHRS